MQIWFKDHLVKETYIIGFGVNELAGINLDYINLTPLKCTNELNEPDVIYLPIG